MRVNNYKQDEEKTKFSFNNMLRILKYTLPYKKELFSSTAMGILSSIFLLFIPKIVSYTVDTAFIEKNIVKILCLALLMLCLILISLFITKIRRYKQSIILNHVAHDLKVEIFSKLQYLPTTYYDTKSNGKIYTRATSYPDDVASVLCYVFIEIFLEIINLIFIIFFMVTTNIQLSLVSILLMIFLSLFFILLSPIIRKKQHEYNNKESNINAFLSESINGIRITQSFNREEENERILKELEKKRMKVLKTNICIGNLNWSLTGIFSLISMAYIYYIGLKYMYPAVSLGVILAIDSYSSSFWAPIENIFSNYNNLMNANTYLERIFELLDEPLQITNSPDAQSFEIEGNVTFNHVIFGYDRNKIVLSDLNFEIKKGQKVGIVGETGCGKTTILNLISRFYDIIDGEILIDNVNIKNIKLENLRGQISIMFQDNFLFARSVYENLILNKSCSRIEVQNICQKLGIHDIILSLENGYDTILYNNGSNLSNGERQLLCLARIMIQDPKILILDEATSNVDAKTEKKIEEAMSMVSKNRTTIMVAHRLSTIKNTDVIFVMKDGKLIETGTHDELIKQNGYYNSLYMKQYKVL